MLNHRCYRDWDDSVWDDIRPIYEAAFPEHGRKSKAIIQRVLERGYGVLHAGVIHEEVVAMALTSNLNSINAILIDYLAVKTEIRGTGIGSEFLKQITTWAEVECGLSAAILEVEAEDDGVRMAFWQRNGFVLTDYVHQYVWVPELYRAMYYQFHASSRVPTDGKRLFDAITSFHGKAYRG